VGRKEGPTREGARSNSLGRAPGARAANGAGGCSHAHPAVIKILGGATLQAAGASHPSLPATTICLFHPPSLLQQLAAR
jgi:hypothetical protein